MPPQGSQPPKNAPTPGTCTHIASPLYRLLGTERGLRENVVALRSFSSDLGAPVVGALLCNCSDGAERECSTVFQHEFVDQLLPAMTHHARAAFQTTNLGGRYETGSSTIAEDHFGSALAQGEWKLMVIKINAHAAVQETPEGLSFGMLERYSADSVCCGALGATLQGDRSPFADELAETFRLCATGDSDRMEALRDPANIPPRHRMLFGALLNARLQARRCMHEVQRQQPSTPTLTLILSSVSLNRPGPDGEILCGVYTADQRMPEGRYEYCGLGDLPGEYRLSGSARSLVVDDPERMRPRDASGI